MRQNTKVVVASNRNFSNDSNDTNKSAESNDTNKSAESNADAYVATGCTRDEERREFATQAERGAGLED